MTALSQLAVNRIVPATPSTVAIDEAVMDGPVLDITHPSFGAIAGGSGVDNAAAILTAYAKAKTYGGATIRVPRNAARFRVASEILLDGSVPVVFDGDGELTADTDVKVLRITGSNMQFRGTRFVRTPAAGSASIFSIEGGSNIALVRPVISGAHFIAIYCYQASKIKIHSPFIYRSNDHAIHARNACDDIEIIGGRIEEPGYNNAGAGAGKGIGIMGIEALTTNVRIMGTTILEPNQAGLELFGDSGNSAGVQYFEIVGVIIRSTKAASGQRFGISLDNAQDGSVSDCYVKGTEYALEVAGGCKRVTYDTCTSKDCVGLAFGISNNSGSATNDPDDVILSNIRIVTPTGRGIECTKAKSLIINNPQIVGAGDRGIMLNQLGTDSVCQVRGGSVRGGAKAGVYAFFDGTTSGQKWMIDGVQAFGNNTSSTGGEDDFVVNADTQAHASHVRITNIQGGLSTNADKSPCARTSDLALSASATTSVGLAVRYFKGERMELIYRLPVQVTGGTAGLKFKLDSTNLPGSITGRIKIRGNTSGTTAWDTEQATALTTTTSTGFLTASFTGEIEIVLSLSPGSTDGYIDLQVVTGASAAGSIFKNASVELRRT